MNITQYFDQDTQNAEFRPMLITRQATSDEDKWGDGTKVGSMMLGTRPMPEVVKAVLTDAAPSRRMWPWGGDIVCESDDGVTGYPRDETDHPGIKCVECPMVKDCTPMINLAIEVDKQPGLMQLAGGSRQAGVEMLRLFRHNKNKPMPIEVKTVRAGKNKNARFVINPSS